MINVAADGLLGRGVPTPYSLAELQAMASELDRDETESVFPPRNSARAAAPGRHVPHVVGMDLGTARKLLSAVGFVANTVGASEPTPEDAIVVAQEPPGGRLAGEGETVTLDVGR